MGFRSFSDFNAALLAKQGWRIIHNPNSLLAQCLKARYFPRVDFMRAPVGHAPSFTWRSIHHGKQSLEKGCLWRVGSGDSINIWSDNWLPKQFGYKVWTPKPLHSNVTFVAELIDQEEKCWNHHLVSSLFMPFEAQQILQIPLPHQYQSDKLIWGPDKRGEFSVKSAYHLMRTLAANENDQQSAISTDDGLWSKLWGIKATPSHIHLVWRILHDKLPTKLSLSKRGIVTSPVCDRCSECAESVSHIFMGCDYARRVWFASPLGLRFDQQTLDGTQFFDWLAEVIKKYDDQVLQLVLSVCYGIWHSRNKFCFEQRLIHVPQVVNKVISSVQEYYSHNWQHEPDLHSSQQIAAPIHTSWCPPNEDCYKLNVDAAGPLHDYWGIGAVIRNHVGEVMAAGRWKLPCLDDAAVAEALALKTGLQFARDLFFIQLHAETDSATVVAAMNKEAPINNYMGLLIQDCKSLLGSFSTFRCTHVRRQANQAAHGLAKSALCNSDKIWLEDIPDCIADIISLDVPSLSVE